MITLTTSSNSFKTHHFSVQPFSEEILVHGLCNQQPEAFNTLYRMYAAKLLGVIFRIVNQQETAEDILQEVFLKIRRSIAGYHPDRAKLFTWMINIARYAAIDHLRTKSYRNERRQVIFEDAAVELDNHIHFPNTDTIGVKKLLEGLNPKQQLILELCYFKGFSHSEIAELLDMPLGSVKTSIRLAILGLRKVFNTD